jgi:hypothetical protein
MEEWQRSWLEYYVPNGGKPDDHQGGNDDPDENAQPSAHAVARAVLPVPGLNQSRVWLTSGLP